MGERTGISWAGRWENGKFVAGITCNFWWGCQKVFLEGAEHLSACAHCYAAEFARSPRGKLITGNATVWGDPSVTPRQRKQAGYNLLAKANRKGKRDGVMQTAFIQSMSDLFEDHPMLPEWREEALTLMESSSWVYQRVLTKRPENIIKMSPETWLSDWPQHVRMGTSVGSQIAVDLRTLHMRNVVNLVKANGGKRPRTFYSVEPLLDEIDLSVPLKEGWLDWVIVGGESKQGKMKARPFDLNAAISVIEQCKRYHVPVFVKQMGDNPVFNGKPVGPFGWHGENMDLWPEPLQVQEFPHGE